MAQNFTPLNVDKVKKSEGIVDKILFAVALLTALVLTALIVIYFQKNKQESTVTEPQPTQESPTPTIQPPSPTQAVGSPSATTVPTKVSTESAVTN